MTEIAEKTHVGLKREVSHDLQPSHVEVSKLNKFFGRHAPVQKRDASSQESFDEEEGEQPLSEDGSEESDPEDLDNTKEKDRTAYKKNQKLRKYFGAPVDAEKGLSVAFRIHFALLI